MTSFKAAIKDPLIAKKYKIFLTVTVFAILFGWFVVVGVYSDHQSLISRINVLEKNQKNTNETDELKKTKVNTGLHAKPSANLASIRIASQKQISSTVPGLPYALEVIIQTDKMIEPVAFIVEFDGPIGNGNVFISGGGVRTEGAQGVMGEKATMYGFEWRSPPFTPDRTITVEVLSKTYV